MMRVAILAPIANSLYSRLVAHLAAAEPNIELVAIVVRTPWNLNRIKGEFRRDGARLIHKVRTKLVIREDAAAQEAPESIGAFAQRVGLGSDSLEAFAAKRQIPYVQAADHNAPSVLEALRKAAPDVIAFTGGGLIRNPLLAIPRHGILNCHCGLLPLYRGMDVVEWPAAEGRFDDPGIGLTLHFMDNGLDTGPILLCKPIELRMGDTFESIRERVPEMQVNMILDGLRGLRDGSIQPQPQEASAGRQYFVMHPRIRSYAVKRLRESLERS
jgi:folate-dependent phosphoribosylglycinamide formyltransferase PurN